VDWRRGIATICGGFVAPVIELVQGPGTSTSSIPVSVQLLDTTGVTEAFAAMQVHNDGEIYAD
jgi:hypothetical protein